MDEKKQNFLKTEFAVFDVETSGLDPMRDEVLEIAAIKILGGEEIGRFEALIQPSRAVPPEAEKIHGLNEIFLLTNGRRNTEAFADFFGFVGEATVVGHNIKEFDWLFVLSQIKKMALPAPNNRLIDTLELSRQLLNLPGYHLAGVAKHFGFEHKNAHRAMPDVEINTRIFLRLMDLLFERAV